jgi:hypothetical protein
MTRIGYLTILVGASLGVASCTGDINDGGSSDPGSSDGTTGGVDNTFDHMNDGISVWDLIDRLSVTGPPSFTAHMHGCVKPRYATLGNMLTTLGVNTANATVLSAGDLYRNGASAMGAASLTNRIRENIDVTTSGAAKMFDIFVAGADEITAATATRASCGQTLFNADNSCNVQAISCLIGTNATQTHADLCKLSVTGASDLATGKRLAVAVLLAAAHTCE